MRTCILTYDTKDPHNALADDDIPADPTPYLEGHDCTTVHLDKHTAVHRLTQLVREGYDLFFNLCDGAWDDASPGIEVVLALERLDVPFTGATSAFYEPSREAMKRVCHAWGVATPEGVEVRTAEDLERALDTLRFPLIVKHPSSYASVGMTRASRVETAEALREQVEQMTTTYGRALVEEFIEGRELTVLVAEHPDPAQPPTAYAPIEYRFPEGETFKHYDLKWVNYHGLEAAPCADGALAEEVREGARRLFAGLGGAGYGRCDVRVDRDGVPYFLEINPNCGIYYPLTDPGSADLILAHDPAGHRGFTRHIVEAALARHARGRTKWAVRRLPGRGYGLVATAPIAAGETVLRFEERPHALVTRSHVEAHWDGRHRDWFARYAWPLTEEVWVMWEQDPEAWKPVNHHCDPSAWLSGLDVTARRAIAPGEEITLDYATYVHESAPPFVCTCGAEACRGVVSGADVLAPFVARYEGHVSDYVRALRAREGVAAAPLRPAPKRARKKAVIHPINPPPVRADSRARS
ncbi:MAG TPA: SET domain-containing protein-lysine N-methyltransferase [Rubricoccaceae bacterium]|nr:SET domain-containing protein-lysine N-methyltransferase [Rubricoccaceae bacterium]